MVTDKGPVILLQTTNPIDVVLGRCLLVSHQGAFLRQCCVHAASQEDDGFVFIAMIHAVILSWDIEPTYQIHSLLSDRESKSSPFVRPHAGKYVMERVNRRRIPSPASLYEAIGSGTYQLTSLPA
ncbi:hypothetical protein GGR53DRAFT_90558 [Hypoxylon sp. FL1150]|nr:hypothetical protein GGR53DRAFT_90558 [Hypoxylon sp. FL1150]